MNISETSAAVSLASGSRIRIVAVVLLAATILFINNGFILAGLTAFDSSILAELHISITALRMRDTVTIGSVCVLAPIGGYLIDRFGVKPLLALGQAVMAGSFIAYGHIHSANQIYLLHLLLGVSQIFSGFIICIILVTRLRTSGRGTAVGVVLAGSSLGNALAPHFNLWSISHWGWRTALSVDAIPPLLMLPLILVLVPAGRANVQKTPATVTQADLPPGRSFSDAVRQPNFWLLSVVALTTFCCVLGLVTNMALYGQRDLGFQPEQAGSLLSILFTAALASQLGAGFLSDRLPPKLLHAASLALMVAGCVMLAAEKPELALWGALVYGIGWGGNYALLQVAITSLFAGPAIGRVMGAIGVLEAAGGALGPVGCGALYDRFGNYQTAFAAAAGTALLALIAVSCLRFDKGRPVRRLVRAD